VNWIAYCITCQKELENCQNGNFAEVAAKQHRRNHWGHQVIVGYEYHPPGFNERMKLYCNQPNHY